MKLILKDKLKFMTKGDFFLIGAMLALIAVLFIKPLSSDENLYGEIYLNSEKLHSVYLEKVDESYSFKAGECEILIEKDGISFHSSQCPDKLCIKSGKLSKSGDAMACIPERVVVVIKSDKAVHDAVSY